MQARNNTQSRLVNRKRLLDFRASYDLLPRVHQRQFKIEVCEAFGFGLDQFAAIKRGTRSMSPLQINYLQQKFKGYGIDMPTTKNEEVEV